jgi:hypothetical protein
MTLICDDDGNMFNAELVIEYDNDPEELKRLCKALLEKCTKLDQENAKLKATTSSPKGGKLLEDWNKLDDDHKKFVLRVRDGGGCKHGADPSSIDSEVRHEPPNEEYFHSTSLWEKTEESGFVECIGSYKWIVTDKYKDLEALAFGISTKS